MGRIAVPVLVNRITFDRMSMVISVVAVRYMGRLMQTPCLNLRRFVSTLG